MGLFRRNNEEPQVKAPVVNARELWQNMLDFKFDDPDAEYPLSHRLADDQGWEQLFALRVLEEYRKFMFLIMVTDHMCVPSKIVDEAWHLHLIYTRSYWYGLCKGVLGREVHHSPSKGGKAEEDKFAGLYERTLDSYEKYFGATPPADIWGCRHNREQPSQCSDGGAVKT
jgi:hypothetical protein